jgi:hypothetical protein
MPGHLGGHIEQAFPQFQAVFVQEKMDEQGDVLFSFPQAGALMWITLRR